ncbi:hypothetical protein [Paraburkholderia tropica]|uniref:hypothetical protein n=1 Tax=Paraburkholderia tropica TaxID=92647 RepID=UPI003D29B533
MSERLDWIEEAAIENMKAHHACADVIAKDAATTLTVFLAAMAGGMTYAAKAIEQKSWTWFSIGATAFTVWFFVLSALLVWKCLMMRPIPPVYNEPRNLNQSGFELEALKEAELEGFQRRIDEAASRNARVAKWLNGLRLSAVGSPIIFILAATVAWAAGR